MGMMGKTLMFALAILLGSPAAAGASATFTLSSPAFRDGAPLSVANEYGGGMGCRGGNRAPRLTWSGVPAGTRGFALTVVDPDVTAVPGGFVHWVVYNIPASWRYMYGNGPLGTTGGTSGFGARSYNGPCPPLHSSPHHYHFTLYALNLPALATPGLTRDALLRAISGHVLGTAQLIGTFQRP